ncbi:GTP cyclohydrolase I [Stachybotrys elegans]|uniref:GTP cyclohydrolase 1 n=1 Tax=Stachybotrys elegans TaxID=80388 RepID=A0A8K0WMA8_9HYPO|nr:GTP cyclohydrolase I [Stachybotrys elegans]
MRSSCGRTSIRPVRVVTSSLQFKNLPEAYPSSKYSLLSVVMLQAHPVGSRDATDSSEGGAGKCLLAGQIALRRSNRSKSSRDGNDEPAKVPTNNRRRNRERKCRTTREDYKRTAPSNSDSDSNGVEDNTTYPRPPVESHSPAIDCDGLSRPGDGTRDRLGECREAAAARLERLQGAVRTMLECVGENPDREGLLATPERYARAMMDLTKGYEQNVLDIVNGAIFHEHHNEMVIVKDIEIYSLCEHHLVPFTGMMHIGYIPQNNVIGLSKLARIAEMFGRRLQVQERLTKCVADVVYEVLQPQGVAVVMESKHLCMAMRGVQKTSSTTVTSCMIGCFEQRPETRKEFLTLVNMNR